MGCANVFTNTKHALQYVSLVPRYESLPQPIWNRYAMEVVQWDSYVSRVCDCDWYSFLCELAPLYKVSTH